MLETTANQQKKSSEKTAHWTHNLCTDWIREKKKNKKKRKKLYICSERASLYSKYMCVAHNYHKIYTIYCHM